MVLGLVNQTVYRVEDSLGNGPYCHKNMGWLDCGDSENHPKPNDDGITIYGAVINWSHKWRCGFVSIQQLCEWFDDDVLDALDHAGYVVSVYVVEHVMHGQKQIVFDRDSSKKVQQLSPVNDLLTFCRQAA